MRIQPRARPGEPSHVKVKRRTKESADENRDRGLSLSEAKTRDAADGGIAIIEVYIPGVWVQPVCTKALKKNISRLRVLPEATNHSS